MSVHFIEGVKAFYADNPDVAVTHHGKKITNPADTLEKSLFSLCNNPNYIIENSHLSRVCCDAEMFRHHKRSKMTEHERDLFDQRLKMCWMVNSGTKPYDDTSILTHKANEDHALVTTIAGGACKDIDFNNKHSTECCTSPGLVLGFSNDDERVAHACGVARQ